MSKGLIRRFFTFVGMKIRLANATDAAELAILGARTFRQSFAYYEANNIKREYTPEDLAVYLDTAFSEQKLVQELSDQSVTYFIVEVEQQAVGYAKLSTAQTQKYLPNENAIELERIYVDDSYTGQEVGTKLMHHVIEYAKTLGYATLWLGVWEHNVRALAFYKIEGFVEFSFHYFAVGQSQVKDLLLKCAL